MCFTSGRSFGFDCVPLTEFPKGMDFKEVLHSRRMEEFQHAFKRDVKTRRRYRLFALCEKGKFIYNDNYS